MRKRTKALSLAALASVLILVTNASAALIGIYRNSMETEAQRKQIVKLSGESCGRSSSSHVFQIVVGKQTRECSYRTPVVGHDLEVAAVERLLSSTPKPIQHKAFVAVNLRTEAGGAGYQLAVYPLQRKVQLRKIRPDGSIKYLQIAKGVGPVGGLDEATELRLRTINAISGPEKGTAVILGFVGGERVVEATDEAAGELEGQASGFSVGAATNATGAVATVDNVVVRVPSPF
ncbi:MAG: hypothetical protein WBM00_04480 [Solirubrobacterales bacterium]